jgi:hypothetical protein
VALSSTLIRRDLSAGCGCWAVPRANRAALLARNGLLLVLAATSLAGTPTLDWRVVLAGIPMGIVYALLIMEIPSIHQYFADAQGVAP